jgi:opacity protein-like surface antigen
MKTMQHQTRRAFSALRPARTALACAALAAAGAASAQDESTFNGPGHWRLVVSPYTAHFNYSDEHRYVWAIGVERQSDNGWLYGASYFSNSFGQDSGYAYVGQTYPGLFDTPALFAQWSAGLLYGYKGVYQNKVPLNRNGFSPGAVFSLGWRFTRQTSAQANLLGNSALMLQLSHDFD